MPILPLAIAGGAAGALSGVLSSKKTAGSNAGNPFTGLNNQAASDATNNFLNYQGSQDALNGVQGSNTATNQVQNNAILGGLFGTGGTMQNTIKQENDLSNRGYSLKPEDYEAYGQVSGQIARNTDTAEQGLSQALAARGLSNSGSANRAFMTSQGNKMEQLGQMQTQIAQQRMQMNLQRLSQTQNFLSSLGQQAGNDINQQYGRQLQGEQQNFNEAQGKSNAAQNALSNLAGQGNQNFEQNLGTQKTPGWAAGLGGALSGGLAGAQMGGMFGGGTAATSGNSQGIPGNSTVTYNGPTQSKNGDWASYYQGK